jgi:cell division septation protein DedD
MKRTAQRAILIGTALTALLTGGAAWADVKTGVDAWSRGDYAAAVHEWLGPAAAGDADAMFNLGQAYRLGRGVPQDAAKAEELYARAAAKGHLQAADTYGLMLFQDGRREAALPYLQDAVRRGDPRAEYLLGIAHFNGDAVPKDWVRAYALVTLANQHSLPQAATALAQMDHYIPLEQRQQAQNVALQLEDQANATRGRALASADLGTAAGVSAAPPATPTPAASPRVPRPLATVAISPSVAAALEAIAEAREATGTETPAGAGAKFARHSSRPVQVAVAAEPAATPKPAAPAAPSPKPIAATPKPAAPASTASADGPWRVQLGAFAVHGNADKLWAALSGRTELAGKAKLKVPAGAVTKLQAGGYADREAAEDACRSLKRAGHDCLVTQ